MSGASGNGAASYASRHSRSKNLSTVVQATRETVGKHARCLEMLPFTHETGARFRFHRADDPQRGFVLTALVVELPT